MKINYILSTYTGTPIILLDPLYSNIYQICTAENSFSFIIDLPYQPGCASRTSRKDISTILEIDTQENREAIFSRHNLICSKTNKNNWK